MKIQALKCLFITTICLFSKLVIKKATNLKYVIPEYTVVGINETTYKNEGYLEGIYNDPASHGKVCGSTTIGSGMRKWKVPES